MGIYFLFRKRYIRYMEQHNTNTVRAEIHANAGDTYRPRARCGATLKIDKYASAQSGAATNNPGLVTCPECLRGWVTA